MSTDSGLASEVGAMRARDVGRSVARQIDAREGDVTTAEVEEWERVAYRRWREQWPALNSLLFDGGAA